MQLKNLASPIHSSKNGYLGRGMHQAKHMLNVSKIWMYRTSQEHGPTIMESGAPLEGACVHVWVCVDKQVANIVSLPLQLKFFAPSKLWCNLAEVEHHPSEWDRPRACPCRGNAFFDQQNTSKLGGGVHPGPIWRSIPWQKGKVLGEEWARLWLALCGLCVMPCHNILTPRQDLHGPVFWN